MFKKGLAGLVLLVSISSGCSITDYRMTLKGNEYMAGGDYSQAERAFQEEVRKAPDSALAHFYLGRFLLAQDKAAEALPQFDLAVAINSKNPDYYFWLGMSYGEMGNSVQERSNYEQVLRLDKNHAQARLYLGHLQLREGELKQALHSYDAVLKLVPTNGAALYNRALILDHQGQRTEAKMAWLEYLKWFPAGRQAIYAADHLNALGDFSYENQYFGQRTVTLAEIKPQPRMEQISMSAYPPLRLFGAIVTNMAKGDLEIVVYKRGDVALAQKEALAIKQLLYEFYPTLGKDRIRASWFGTEEQYEKNGKIIPRDHSVRFFLTDWQ
jgi:tetratricopeptide (TPR) repeat protein